VEDLHFSAVRNYLFNILAYAVEAGSSIRNLRTRLVVVRRDPRKMENVEYMLVNSIGVSPS
jgi:hypothetical protein